MALFSAKDGDIGSRIDMFVSSRSGVTRSAAQILIERGDVKVNGKDIKKNYLIRNGDEISVSIPAPKETDIKPQDMNLEALYEDDDLIVINKRQGMTVHPSQDNYEDTLVNALLFHCKGSLSGINGEIRPGIVHRLDKDTAGVMIAAKSDRAHLGLAEQIKNHTFTRIYHTILYGDFKEDTFTLDKPLGRSKKDYKKIAVYNRPDEENGIKNAVTHFTVIGRYKYKNSPYCYMKVQLETGRTHQIRVHAASLNHPVVGDPVYGREEINSQFPHLTGQCLFSKSIKFIHPVTNEEIYVEAGLPEFFIRTLELLKL